MVCTHFCKDRLIKSSSHELNVPLPLEVGIFVSVGRRWLIFDCHLLLRVVYCTWTFHGPGFKGCETTVVQSCQFQRKNHIFHIGDGGLAGFSVVIDGYLLYTVHQSKVSCISHKMLTKHSTEVRWRVRNIPPFPNPIIRSDDYCFEMSVRWKNILSVNVRRSVLCKGDMGAYLLWAEDYSVTTWCE